MPLPTKSVVVTGSGGAGCGRAIAQHFANEGAAVVVSDINEPGGNETVRLITNSGGRAAFCRADVRDQHRAHALLDFCVAAFGRLDILVNNASGPEFRPDQPLELWKEIVETDLLGTMYTTRHAIDLMREHGGAIVNVTSISALPHGREHAAPAYDAAKAGVLRLTTMLAFLANTHKFASIVLPPGGSPRRKCAPTGNRSRPNSAKPAAPRLASSPPKKSLALSTASPPMNPSSAASSSGGPKTSLA
jgi:NAD(P)-dependent dehydrogenase (short-subunit alcohol dehydrogenase family)